MPSMYVERISRPSFFSRLDVRVKLFIMFLASTLIFVWESIVYQFAMLLVALGLALSAHIGIRYIRRLFIAMIPFMLLVLLIHGLFNPQGQRAIASVPEWVPLLGGRLSLYWEGLVFGGMVLCRILTPLLILPLVVMTTDVNDLMLGLVKLRVPYKVAYVFSVGLRFVPFIFSEITTITEAQRLRGLAIEKMGFIKRIPVFASLAVPLILGALAKAQTLEIALQSKAFSGSSERTFTNDFRMRGTDYLALTGGVVLLLGAILTRLLLDWGAFVS